MGLKDDFNGPICYTPDGNPLVGPAPGLRNMWLAEGFSFGITAAGGTGHYLAQMMVEGEAEIDMAALDPKRYGPLDDHRIRGAKNEECYRHVFILHHPDEERAGLPAAAHLARLRPAEGARRAVRAGERLGAAELLRPGGRAGRASTTTPAASAAAAGGNTPRPRRGRSARPRG